MRKGLGRSAALLAMSSAATVVLTLGPGLGAAHADILDDKGRCDDKKSEEWDIFGDKDNHDKDDRDKDGDKEVRAAIGDNGDKNDGRDDGRDDDKVDGRDDDKDRDKDDDWFGDKDDKDRDKDDCPVGVVGGVGVGGVGVGGAPAGGVGAGGGGAAGDSSPLLPIAGAGLGALLIGAGMRRRGQGAA